MRRPEVRLSSAPPKDSSTNGRPHGLPFVVWDKVETIYLLIARQTLYEGSAEGISTPISGYYYEQIDKAGAAEG